MPINKNEITKEMIAKAMQCETAEDLVALAKSEGIEITKAEAEAYLAEMDGKMWQAVIVLPKALTQTA